jgi:hypothetical protein
MKKTKSSLRIVLLLAAVSLMIYAVQILVFGSPHDTLFYALQDIAFLPLQIAIVTVVLGRYLKSREKEERLAKINIVINVFFSDAGTDLLMSLLSFSNIRKDISLKLNVKADWTDNLFLETVEYYKNLDFQIKCGAEQLKTLKLQMKSKRDFLIQMIENPNLLEHETFTDMLLAVFHLAEELTARKDFADGNTSDMKHLSLDIQRAFQTLLIQWVEYMRHLRLEYPYLYSLEVRKNLFLKEGSIEVNG